MRSKHEKQMPRAAQEMWGQQREEVALLQPCWAKAAPEAASKGSVVPSSTQTIRSLILEHVSCWGAIWLCLMWVILQYIMETQDTSHVSALCFSWRGNPSARSPGSHGTVHWRPDKHGMRTFATHWCWLNLKPAFQEAPWAVWAAGHPLWLPWWMSSPSTRWRHQPVGLPLGSQEVVSDWGKILHVTDKLSLPSSRFAE